MINKIKNWFSKPHEIKNEENNYLPLDQWYFVTFDEEMIYLKVNPPGNAPWEQSLRWSSIIRVCFKDEGQFCSDGIYIFTSERPESYVIPTEAHGGSDFFGKLVGKGFFPKEIMIKAMSSTDGGLYCWPSVEDR